MTTVAALHLALKSGMIRPTFAQEPLLLKALIVTMRPRQWSKNGLLFLGLIFTINQYWRPFSPQMYQMLGMVVMAFLLFCLLSSSVYLINDLADIEKDRAHPTKRFRPLPSGQLSPTRALAAAAVLAIGGLAGSFYLGLTFGLVALLYLLTMLTYSFALKNMVLVDVLTISLGFVLRAVAGAVVIAVPISPWLYVCTLLGALFLGFSKRRHELLLLNDQATNHRQILKEYTPEFLEELITIVVSATIMAYSLYTFSAEGLPKNHAMMATIPFVLYGAFRYLYLVHLKNLGGSPEDILLSDKPILLDIALWVLSVSIILYFFR
ncbi:MAG: decaprenyl-phosphate phosphoribosyltransferase [Chloroflexota bacterium]